MSRCDHCGAEIVDGGYPVHLSDGRRVHLCTSCVHRFVEERKGYARQPNCQEDKKI